MFQSNCPSGYSKRLSKITSLQRSTRRLYCTPVCVSLVKLSSRNDPRAARLLAILFLRPLHPPPFLLFLSIPRFFSSSPDGLQSRAACWTCTAARNVFAEPPLRRAREFSNCIDCHFCERINSMGINALVLSLVNRVRIHLSGE